jgi:hypothetical protein
MKIHGKWKSKEWNSWNHMRQRCNNPSHTKYSSYGGVGIKVCERWDNFENFIADVGLAPSPTHTIDRFPNKDGNYEPNNVRWATPTEQSNNTKKNRKITINGETGNISVIARKYNKNPNIIRMRLELGWSTEDAVLRPIRKQKQKSK